MTAPGAPVNGSQIDEVAVFPASGAVGRSLVDPTSPSPLVTDAPVRKTARIGPFSDCQSITIENTQAFLCVPAKPSWLPSADALPGVVTAFLGFALVHALSVRRQRRDEQFKMVSATRDLLKEVTDEAILAWSKRSGRRSGAETLVHRVARVSQAARYLQLRDKRFNLTAEMVAFRRAVTNDFEAGSVAISRRTEISRTSEDLDGAVYRRYLDIYG